MNKAWFFGDSFTAGWGAVQGHEYYEKYGPGKTFSSIISEHYNCTEVNYGLPGKCNNGIIRTIVENLSNINPYDIVIVSNTSPLRDLVPSKSTKHDINSPVDSIKFGLISQKLFNSPEHPGSIGYEDPEIHKLLSEYCLRVKKPYIQEWNYHYRHIFLNFVNYFLSINCQSLFWDYSVWSEDEEIGMKFENIHQATDTKVQDWHWSFKGHKDAAYWIIQGLKEKKKFLN